MTLSDDLEKLLCSFQELKDESNELLMENTKNKTLVREKEAELVDLSAKCEQLEKDLRQQQELFELVHKQLSLIPELKTEIEKQNTVIAQLESRLEHKDQEINKLKTKHLNDLNFLRLEIEDERLKSREAENKRIMDLEEFYKQAQAAEVTSLMKKVEREKVALSELLDRKEVELRNVSTEHQEELEKLKIQLVAAKSKENSSPSAFGSEFYRKKILAIQEHYESQFQELIDSKQPTESSSSEKRLSPPKSSASQNSQGGLTLNPTVPSTPIPHMDEFDHMADGLGSSLKEKSFKAPISKHTPASMNNEAPKSALKKKKVTFRLSSSQKSRANQKENGNLNAIQNPEPYSFGFSTPTNRNKSRDTSATGFQYPPSSTTKSGRSKAPGGPLNESFWNSITEDSSPFEDVSFSRVSPKKTSTVTSAFFQFQPSTASRFSRPNPSHSTSNNNSSFVNSKTQSKFKFSNVSRPQVLINPSQNVLTLILSSGR